MAREKKVNLPKIPFLSRGETFFLLLFFSSKRPIYIIKLNNLFIYYIYIENFLKKDHDH